MKRRSPRGGTPVKPASPGSGRRGSPLRAMVFVFVPPWAVCRRPFFSSRWLAAFAGGAEGGRTTARSFPICGLGAFAAGADLVTRWAADVRSVRLSPIAATATSSGTSRIPARFQYGVAPGCMKRPSIDHQPVGRDCADFASTGQPGGVTFVLRQRPFSRRSPDRRMALLHRRIDPYARLGFAALNTFHDLRQTQFRGKKRSVSDLVTCDFHKPPWAGCCYLGCCSNRVALSWPSPQILYDRTPIAAM